MKCPKCDSTCKEFAIDKLIICYCDNCWSFITQSRVPCENHNPVYVKFKNSNGAFHLKRQCFQCGKIESPYLPKNSVSNFDSLPEANVEADAEYDKIYYEKIGSIYKRYEEKRKKFIKEQSLDKFLTEHGEYLKSEEWRARRELVLVRDNFICQSCLVSKATQVHHKSYRYWKNEPLFELVSVCEVCHEKITEMNREVINFNNVVK